MVVRQPSKLFTWVRFPSPAPLLTHHLSAAMTADCERQVQDQEGRERDTGRADDVPGPRAEHVEKAVHPWRVSQVQVVAPGHKVDSSVEHQQSDRQAEHGFM